MSKKIPSPLATSQTIKLRSSSRWGSGMKRAGITCAGALAMLGTVNAVEDPSLYIDPRIGGVSKLLVPTYTTFHLPNQMIRMIPDKENYIQDQIKGFPFQLLAHRGSSFLSMKVSAGDVSPVNHKMAIDHDLEVMHPWFYSTYLVDDEITVSFAPGAKAAIYHLNFGPAEKKNVLIQAGAEAKVATVGANAFTIDYLYKTKKGDFQKVEVNMPIFCYAEVVDSAGKPVSNLSIEAVGGDVKITGLKGSASEFSIKYAISYISAEQALKSFKGEVAGETITSLSKKGKAAWDKVTGQIKLEGGTVAQKRAFYTALYRTHERMVDVNEGGRYFSGYDGKVHESDRPFYVDDWIWDTYLAKHPLTTLLDTTLASDMLDSYVKMYEQSGWMPTFPQVFGNRMCMNAYHSGPMFLDAYRKGVRGFDAEKAYEGIRKNMTDATWIPWRQCMPKTPLDVKADELGFMPALPPGATETEPLVDRWEKRQSVAVSLGKSYDAWALAEFAADLNKKDDYKLFSPLGQNYRKLWYSGNQFFMPKDENGNWIMINPERDGGPGGRQFYDENNGWTYIWGVQQDIPGLIELLGGKSGALARLDQLFRQPLGMNITDFISTFPDSTGMVGQFSMGNEVSLHIPYLYNYFGAPWKTQKMTRFLLDVWFTDNVHGVPGDEDGGGMSAFVVFTAMGLYPVTPGLPYYDITSPVFEKVTIKLPNEKIFTIEAEGASKVRKYINKAFLNGVELDGPFITHDQIMAGGTLKLELVDKPNKSWGVNAKFPNQF